MISNALCNPERMPRSEGIETKSNDNSHRWSCHPERMPRPEGTDRLGTQQEPRRILNSVDLGEKKALGPDQDRSPLGRYRPQFHRPATDPIVFLINHMEPVGDCRYDVTQRPGERSRAKIGTRAAVRDQMHGFSLPLFLPGHFANPLSRSTANRLNIFFSSPVKKRPSWP